MGRPKKDEPGDRLMMPRSVVRRVRRLAAHADEDPSDWLARTLRPILDREEAKMLGDIAREKKEAEGN